MSQPSSPYSPTFSSVYNNSPTTSWATADPSSPVQNQNANASNKRRLVVYIVVAVAMVLLVGAIVAIALGVTLADDDGTASSNVRGQGNADSGTTSAPYSSRPSAVTAAPQPLPSTTAPTPNTAFPTVGPSVVASPAQNQQTNSSEAITVAPITTFLTINASSAPSDRPSSVPSVVLSDSDFPSHAPSHQPSHQPSFVPTAPTPSPTRSLFDIIVANMGADAELDDPNSYQFLAFQWLAANHNHTLSDARLLQRYALSCMYYSTNGPGWINSTNWMSDLDECNWAGITCMGSDVVALNMQENSLTGWLPSELLLLAENLMLLDVSDNELEGDSAWMGGLTSLESLNLAFTALESSADDSGIPTEFGRLTNLVELDLSDALFGGPLDDAMWTNMDQLVVADLSRNVFGGSFPSTLASLPSLEFLYLQQCDLSGNIEFMGNFQRMREFWVDGNQNLGDTIPTEIGRVSSLVSLSMSFCNISGTLPTELGQLSDMIQMWFYQNPLTGKIPSEIGNLTKMKIFDLEATDLTGTMPAEVCALVTSSTSVVTTLWTDCAAPDPELVCDCCTRCS